MMNLIEDIRSGRQMARDISDSETGFVYVLSNQSFPGLVKVGFTTLLAEDRAADLFRTGVPTEFRVEFRACSSFPRAVEAHAHEILKSCRVNSRREFFRASVDRAIGAVRQAIRHAAGIASWGNAQPISLSGKGRISFSMERGQLIFLLAYRNLSDILAGKPGIIDIWQAHSDGDVIEIFAAPSSKYVAGFSDSHPGSEEDPVPYLDRGENVVNGIINGRECLMPGDRLVWLSTPAEAAEELHVVLDADDYCQVVSRTWKPALAPHGVPRLLNYVTHESIWPEAIAAVRDALAMPVPRIWAPRERGEEWEPFGVEPQPPEYWLKQLGNF
jgi:hypothetical protein